MIPKALDGRIALVTGAAGNLGQALCGALADAGARVAMIDRDAGGLSRLAAELPDTAQAAGFAADVSDATSVSGAVDAVRQGFGRIDILANIAGGFRMGTTLDETDDATWDLMMDLNARSVFNCCRAVVPLMKAQRSGRIINVSARAALAGKGLMGPYCASKAAVITLTETLSVELKDHGINVNCILPGTVDTPQNREAMPDAEHDRWVPPAALADVILFLASDAARCVTGAAVPVYGRS
jgi:NAD(P)-dependent dehydrogenase (short-subunit alcohol dehydrogenase family)